jgi:hypothetical protein
LRRRKINLNQEERIVMRRITVLLSVEVEVNDECLDFDQSLTTPELHAEAASHLTVVARPSATLAGMVLETKVVSAVLSSMES